MARTLLSTLEELHQNIVFLADREAQLQKRISELETTKANLEAELTGVGKELAAALSDVEFLKVSCRLADNPESIVEARRHIARLIRNLDLCIDMLKEG